jgi:hypothetical protein
VDTVGFNGKVWVRFPGLPSSEMLHITEPYIAAGYGAPSSPRMAKTILRGDLFQSPRNIRRIVFQQPASLAVKLLQIKKVVLGIVVMKGARLSPAALQPAGDRGPRFA